MRPRGMPARWKRATPTYAYEASEPSRAAELSAALAYEAAADGEEPMGDELDAYVREAMGDPAFRAAYEAAG